MKGRLPYYTVGLKSFDSISMTLHSFIVINFTCKLDAVVVLYPKGSHTFVLGKNRLGLFGFFSEFLKGL